MLIWRMREGYGILVSMTTEREQGLKGGRFISFEGPEGGGKSTQAKRVVERLKGEGLGVRLVREPGGTSTGELIRGILQHNAGGEPLCDASEVFLFCASRAQLCRRVLGPALERGEWIVCDRFADSTLAYQGYGRGFDLEMLRAFNGFATGSVVPELTFLLDVPSEVGLERVRQRSVDGSKDRIESEALDFHRRLREGYLSLASREPERFVIVDTTKLDIDAASEMIWRTICERYL